MAYVDVSLTSAAIANALGLSASTGPVLVTSGVFSAPNTGDVRNAAGAAVVASLTGTGGVCNVPGGTALTFGATVAAAGDIRLGTAGAISALNGVTDVNVAKVVAGALQYGGTANAGVTIGTSTGNTIAQQVNGAAQFTVGATFFTVGPTASAATAGAGRFPNAVNSVVHLNAAGSANIVAVGVDASNNLQFGTNANANSVTMVGPGGTALGFKINTTTYFRVLQGSVSFDGHTTGTTAPAAGGAGALPATPLGYLTIQIGGTNRQIAYY